MGVALLTALAFPARAGAPGRAARRVALLASHGAAQHRVWIAGPRVYAEVAANARGLDRAVRNRVARTILAEAARTRIDPLLVLAVIQVESSFDPRAVSQAGAMGLMQVLGPTMREVGARSRLASADPFDPVANVQAGVRYLASLVASFQDTDLALLAYNAGPARIRELLRTGGVPARLLAYPHSVAQELERLAAAPAPDLRAAGTRLALDAARAGGGPDA